MAEVESTRGLLVMALQDLFDAETVLVQRLGAVHAHASDARLRAIIVEDKARSEAQRAVLAGIARDLGAKPDDATNIWLRAILDDADNDAETIARGPLRDVALAGALRKGKQSERVSYETAIALAARLGMEDAARALTRFADEEATADEALARALKRICSTLA
jgi:ferritin-like metal-binding protein YciE